MPSRNYLESDLKILWGQSAARCAFPDCRRELVQGATGQDQAQVIGKIAHIVAHSAGGPRADPSVTEEERRREPNLILLCGTHHDVVDAQPDTYAAADLQRWKQEHLAWVAARLTTAVTGVDFVELQRLTAALLAQVAPAVAEVSPPAPPADKLHKNELTATVAGRLRLGSLRYQDVEDFVARTTQADPGYAVRLRDGFRAEYEVRHEDGLRGDALFEAILDWAAGGSTDFDVIAAAIAVITYLFTICDLFEP